MTPPLACPVRRCGRPLERRDRVLACAEGHTHDIAKSGYINLLQPQDRRSHTPGDAREAVQARARLTAAGIGNALIASFVDRVTAWLPAGTTPVIAELGAGTGDLLGALVSHVSGIGIGIDLSAAAAEAAARRFPAVNWIVANADRRLPLLDDSVDLLLSVHARRNPSQAARILTPAGVLAVAVPAHDDLVELREALHGTATARDRIDGVLAEHADAFETADRWSVRDRRYLTRPLVDDLLRTTYRGQRRSAAPRAEALDGLTVTTASDVVALRRRK